MTSHQVAVNSNMMSGYGCFTPTTKAPENTLISSPFVLQAPGTSFVMSTASAIVSNNYINTVSSYAKFSNPNSTVLNTNISFQSQPKAENPFNVSMSVQS